MRRGDLVTVAVSGDYGKPRPALIVQADVYAELLRVSVEPGAGTGLRLRSQVMVDRATTIPRAKVGSRIGRLDTATLNCVSQALAAFLDLG